MHTTNYFNTFIAVAPDCAKLQGTPPKESAKPSIALMTFRLIHDHPYHYTSDDVLFRVHAERNAIAASEQGQARQTYFAKPQACLRSSDLGKRYGWGIHHDAEGRVAIYGMESDEYAALALGKGLTGHSKPAVVYAMRSKR